MARPLVAGWAMRGRAGPIIRPDRLGAPRGLHNSAPDAPTYTDTPDTRGEYNPGDAVKSTYFRELKRLKFGFSQPVPRHIRKLWEPAPSKNSLAVESTRFRYIACSALRFPYPPPAKYGRPGRRRMIQKTPNSLAPSNFGQ